MRMNKLTFAAILLATISVVSCNKKDDGDDTTPTPSTGNTVVSQNISENTTWSKENVYELGGRITVLNGATLTIEAGTIIKGQAGTGPNATALLIARGGKLMAEGTADMPIIFTTVADEIMPSDITAGNFASPNLAPDVNGLWGGLLVCGKARISASNSSGDVTEVQIEGIPTSDQNGLYGGTDDADNSGIIKYVSVRHGGANIGAGNEINGITLAGVGSGTIIENVEVVANQDDGIEWFGGTVSVKNAVVWNAGDDAIDTDQSWSGTLDNFVVITPTGHCFELDGPEGTYAASHIIKNGTVRADFNGNASADLINTDANSMVSLQDIFYPNVKMGQQINRTTGNPGVMFNNIVLNVPAADLDDYIADGSAPSGVTAGASSNNKANATVFNGWSWSAIGGATAGL